MGYSPSIVHLSDRSAVLTRRETEVYRAIEAMQGTPIRAEDVAKRIYGFGGPDERKAIRMNVDRIRRKLGDDAIRYLAPVGYYVGPEIELPRAGPGEEDRLVALYSIERGPSHQVVAKILDVLFPDCATILDASHGRGAFWKGDLKPTASMDICEQDGKYRRATLRGDFTAMPFPDGAFDLVVFDPPHNADAGAESAMGGRYGTYRGADLERMARLGLRECRRVARVGILVKLTNQTHSQRFVPETAWAYQELGTPFGEVHHERGGKMRDPRWGQQVSVYAKHATFMAYRLDSQRHYVRERARPIAAPTPAGSYPPCPRCGSLFVMRALMEGDGRWKCAANNCGFVFEAEVPL